MNASWKKSLNQDTANFIVVWLESLLIFIKCFGTVSWFFLSCRYNSIRTPDVVSGTNLVQMELVKCDLFYKSHAFASTQNTIILFIMISFSRMQQIYIYIYIYINDSDCIKSTQCCLLTLISFLLCWNCSPNYNYQRISWHWLWYWAT